MGDSFRPITAFGKNAAQIHYNTKPATDVRITNESLYMCDTGGQYLEGTTDITRTLHFGTPTAYQKEMFTRVFKGQAAVSMTKFPMKTKGRALDTIARKSLWEVGYDTIKRIL